MVEPNKQGNDGDDANKNGDGSGDGKDQKEHMIPKSRLDEEVAKRKELEKWRADREKADQDAEAKRLADEGKYKEIAEKADARAKEAEAKFQREAKLNALRLEATKAGTVDVDAVVALTKLDDIVVSEDGTIDTKSVSSIIDTMKEQKGYLFGTKQGSTVGVSGGAPQGGATTTPTFTRSQISNTEFYQKNRADILQAQREGKIVDDISPKK